MKKLSFPSPLAFSLAAFSLVISDLPGRTTVLHFSTSDSDDAAVSSGLIPGVDGSPDGTVSGSITLSEDIPTDGVTTGTGNRSMSFTGTQLITIPGTRQLSHTAIIAEGGFTCETWFKWNGGSVLNAMIDYAGTEKFRIQTSTGILDFNFDAGSGPQEIATPVINQWHYVALVFEHDGQPIDADFKIYGTMAWYFDSNEPAGSAPATKDDFGDSLNRTIGVGGHPLGFGADFFTGLLFEPRVTLGALAPTELLYGGSPTELKITNFSYNPTPEAPGISLTWTSASGINYQIEYSADLQSWSKALDAVGADGQETTTGTHEFLPDFAELVDATKLFYRVIIAPDPG
ncbi:MAG: hypothetical protein P1U90_16340 [Akkermansiaceae bacterium]|nr:hypothetical protein [Akkermansiaceae bacterium]